VIEVSWTMVTVRGYGKSESSIFPTTLLLLDTMYHSRQRNSTVTTSRLFRPSSMAIFAGAMPGGRGGLDSSASPLTARARRVRLRVNNVGSPFAQRRLANSTLGAVDDAVPHSRFGCERSESALLLFSLSRFRTRECDSAIGATFWYVTT